MRVYPYPNPFLGLRWFSRNEAARFYGRDSDVVLIQGRLVSARTTLLFAGSGVGKTSLIEARLMPSLERHWGIVPHREWASLPPLEALRGAMLTDATPTDSENASLEQLLHARFGAGPPHKYVLVLDQFEEVFQHWRDSQALDDFAQAIAALVHSSTIDARVLFSMREEFLGELSLFDNLIPDLFNNCYRLKNPTRAEAEEIIERTAKSAQEVECGPGLETLLDDLLAVPRATGTFGVAIAPSSRTRIPMPFLQIVCHRLWEQQFGRQRSTPPSQTERFLETHERGKASDELDAYCREKLEALDEDERDIAAAAFGFLMTPAGAKMAYPVDVLSTHARVPEDRLAAVLRKLCVPDVRILREIASGPTTKPWFELYHDLYARFLSSWKRAHEQLREAQAAQRAKDEQEQHFKVRIQEVLESAERTRRRQFYRQLKVFAPALLILAFFIARLTYAYAAHYTVLRQFVSNASTTTDAAAYADARKASQALSFSLFTSSVRSKWAQYWNQRAQREMVSGAADQAILSQMRSLQEVDDPQGRRQLNSWLGFGETVRTFRLPEPMVSFGYAQRSDRLFAILNGCRIAFWERATAKLLPLWEAGKEQPCESIKAVGPDGAHAVLVGHTEKGLTLSVVALAEKRLLWSTQTSLFDGGEVSFSPDGKFVVVQAEDKVTVVATADGAATPVKPPMSSIVGTYHYSYAPLTSELVADLPDRQIVYSPDGTGPLRTLSLSDASGQFPDTANLLNPRIVLPQGEVAVVGGNRILRVSQAGVKETQTFAVSSLDASVQFAVSPDRSAAFVRRTRYVNSAFVQMPLCRLSGEFSTCESFVWPLGELRDDFAVIDNQTIVVSDPSGQMFREVTLAPSVELEPLKAEIAEIALTSPGGRWVIASGREGGKDGCLLLDLENQTVARLADACGKSEYVFSPFGERLLFLGKSSDPLALIDLQTLARTPLKIPKQTTYWASDDYLTLFGSDGTISLFNVTTQTIEPLPLKPKASQGSFGLITGCAVMPGGSLVSRDGRYAILSEPEGLKLYRHDAGRWQLTSAIANSAAACPVAFSSDSSRILGVVNGSVVSIWTADGKGVRSLTKDFQPLTFAGFWPSPQSIIAVTFASSTYNLLVWDINDSETPVYRAVAPDDVAFRGHQESRTIAVATSRFFGWLTRSGKSDVDLRIRPLPWRSEAWESSTVSANGIIRRLFRRDDGRWAIVTSSPDFSDVQPFALPAGSSWADLRTNFSKRFDIELDEDAGAYVLTRTGGY